ncbi:MraY family glycosyltransferase [Gilvimarinus agarilyticus]|uniref:MraY family glycosyltransferase n=1 Tax=Gilvimarinus agarilyticus TaxID=679259 RepID=UPI00059F5A10|nr:glycosyltransferase family 4 protein [Gilvimarinus agarilyticus]
MSSVLEYAILTLICFTLTALLTKWIRLYALKQGMLDQPGGRSSHTLPTPRGGGLAITLVVSFFLVSRWPLEGTDTLITQSLAIAALVAFGVAAVGFWDDHGHVRSGVRLLIHLLAGLTLTLALPSFEIVFLNINVASGVLGVCLLSLLVAWYINLFNFMDGIDGIAGLEAIFIFAGYGLLAYYCGAPDLVLPAVCVLASAAGFIVWNFPRARIFMGDAGSCFLGVLIMGFLFVLSRAGDNLFWAGLILSGVFIVDASVTLLHRLARGVPVYQAHRTHAYQYAARHFNSHVVVTVGVLGLNVCWLMPMAWVTALGWLPGWLMLLLSYGPLMGLALLFNAGKPESYQ